MLMKTMPQFNLLVVGFPIKIAIGFAVLAAKRDNAKIGNDIIKPNKNRFMTPFAVYLTIFSSG